LPGESRGLLLALWALGYRAAGPRRERGSDATKEREEGTMRKLALFAVLLGTAAIAGLVVPVAADHPAGASMSDIRQLQDDVERLDDSLSQLDDRNPRASEFRRRETAIRDRLTRLSRQVERHRDNPDVGLGATHDDVAELRRTIVDLRNDVDDSLGYRSRSTRSGADRGGRVSVPDGTEIRVRLAETVTSATARREDRVEATVAESIRVRDRVAVPAGASVVGIVTDVTPAERPSHGGRLELSFETMVLDDGERVRIPTRVVSIEESRVDKKRAGLGAIIGGVLGGVLDGTKGAVIGAVLGGGGAVVASKGEEVELPAGTVLTLRLEEPVVVAGTGAAGRSW
jgi:hypothetical protein